jgi:hypothetical protein
MPDVKTRRYMDVRIGATRVFMTRAYALEARVSVSNDWLNFAAMHR